MYDDAGDNNDNYSDDDYDVTSCRTRVPVFLAVLGRCIVIVLLSRRNRTVTSVRVRRARNTCYSAERRRTDV